MAKAQVVTEEKAVTTIKTEIKSVSLTISPAAALALHDVLGMSCGNVFDELYRDLGSIIKRNPVTTKLGCYTPENIPATDADYSEYFK